MEVISFSHKKGIVDFFLEVYEKVAFSLVGGICENTRLFSDLMGMALRAELIISRWRELGLGEMAFTAC